MTYGTDLRTVVSYRASYFGIEQAWERLKPLLLEAKDTFSLRLVAEKCPVSEIRGEARRMLAQETVSPELLVAV